MERTESKMFEDALELLDKAATQKKDELLAVMADKYKHLRSLLVEKEVGLSRSLSDAKMQAVEAVAHAEKVGVEKARALARDLDTNVRVKPWAYIAGAAAASLLLGYLLGRHRT